MNKAVAVWEPVRDKKGNFLGYTEKVSRKEYNHYNQDGVYLGSTEDGDFDFQKVYFSNDDYEEESSP